LLEGGLAEPLPAFVGRLWRPLLIPVGIGGVVGVAAYVLGPWLPTAASGLAGFTASLAVQARMAPPSAWPPRSHQGLTSPGSGDGTTNEAIQPGSPFA
jgi:hypothetical protein